jgi:molecular chaperone DnaK
VVRAQRQATSPNLAVAKGAALLALMKKVVAMSDDSDSGAAGQVADQLGISAPHVEDLAAKHVATVMPRAVGLKVVDSADPVFKIDPGRARAYISHLLTANTPLPADSRPMIFSTVVDNQREIRLEVWEQVGSISFEDLEHNMYIGDTVFGDLPPRPAGTPFEVVFQMTETGLLRAHCRETGSGFEVSCEIQIGGLHETETRHAAAETMHPTQRMLPTSAAVVAVEQDLPKAEISQQPRVFLLPLLVG